jgi:hypothetical protein
VALTRRVWRACRHGIDLNSEGASGERPLRIEPASSPTPARVDRTLRRSWAIRLHHRETETTEYDTVEDVEFDVFVNH